MTTKTVFQLDAAGHFKGTTVADESPLEPGVYLIPAGCIETAPPSSWPADKWPRWNGARYDLVANPFVEEAANDNDPVAKLRDFRAANPDVAAILQQGGV